jgi:hypothetical protein
MAGQSGHNLQILRGQRGCRLPFERPDVGNGYASAGPVTVRQMTPEEREKYGPPKIPRDRDLRRGEVAFAVEHASSLQHAARMARVSVARMKKEMARHCVAVPEEWKEAEEMPAIELTEKEYEKILPPNQNQSNPPEPDKNKPVEDLRKTRREIFKEKLTKELYLQLKEEGLTDNAVLDKVGLPRWTDLMTRMKEKWGLLNQGIKAPSLKPVAEPSRIQQVEEEAAVPGRFTIAQAIELHDDLEEDKDSIEFLLAAIKNTAVSPRVKNLLTWYRDEYQRSLQRVHEVFNTTTVEV